jgi:SAM-dependent methyltransferase
MSATDALETSEFYDLFINPAIYGPWVGSIAEKAGLKPGDKVLDVACGTGALCREAARRVGPQGSVTGLDFDPAMLALAGRKSPGLEWRLGNAGDLPFGNGVFDAVVSHFALVWFDNRRAAVREMYRVLHRGGRLTVAVWDDYRLSEGMTALVDLLARVLGEDAARTLKQPFKLGDRDLLRGAFDGAGVMSPEIETLDGDVRFPSIRLWVETMLRAWTPLKAEIGMDTFDRLLNTAETELSAFAGEDGQVVFNLPAHIVTAVKP